MRGPCSLTSIVLALLASSCASATLTQDGQLAFTPGASQGASVLTANGVEYHDKTFIPERIVHRSADEPFRSPTGFLLPASGVLTAASKPTVIAHGGLTLTLRSSDALVPAWGGEILMRIDASVPADAESARLPTRLVVVIDGHGENVAPLVRAALGDSGSADRVAIVDSAGARPVMPPVPGGDRTLLEAGLESALGHAYRPRDLPGALAVAERWESDGPWVGERHVLVFSDGAGPAAAPGDVARAVARLEKADVLVSAVASADGLDEQRLAPITSAPHAERRFGERLAAVAALVPPPGDLALLGVELVFDAAPSPARVVEVSGGEVRWSLDHDGFLLGDLRAGEARTEVARVAVPSFVPGEPFAFRVRARFVDARTGAPVEARGAIDCRYADDIVKLADQRHGDVIAYASALATVRRLDAAFAGASLGHLGGLRGLARLQAQSLFQLARATNDRALAEQAETLTALLAIPAD